MLDGPVLPLKTAQLDGVENDNDDSGHKEEEAEPQLEESVLGVVNGKVVLDGSVALAEGVLSGNVESVGLIIDIRHVHDDYTFTEPFRVRTLDLFRCARRGDLSVVGTSRLDSIDVCANSKGNIRRIGSIFSTVDVLSVDIDALVQLGNIDSSSPVLQNSINKAREGDSQMM